MHKRCVIITGHIETPVAEAVRVTSGDFVICADGGFDRARAEGIRADLLVGDFDSIRPGFERAARADGTAILRFPPEKDHTDTGLALRHGIEAGFTDFVIVGGVGGRLDHTFANLQTLSYALDRGCAARLADGRNRAFMTDAETFCVRREPDFFFSVFSWSERCAGVSIENAKYELRDAELTCGFPLGVSNAFTDGDVTIRKRTGRLLIMLSRET